MKTLIWVAIIAVIGVGGLYAFTLYQQRPDASPAAQSIPEIEDAARKITNADFSWRVENAPDYEETFPRQIVYLEVKGNSYKAGASIGCDVTSTVQLKNEITRRTCWFGGAGDVYSVFQEDGSYILKHRSIQESGGPEVNAPTEGPWEPVLKIN